jgi:hypothetical protein
MHILPEQSPKHYQRKQRAKALNLVNLRLSTDVRVRAAAQFYFLLGLMIGLTVAGLVAVAAWGG